MGLMAGKRGIIFGVANEMSIAWGIAQALQAHGATLGFSYHPAFEKYARPLVESTGTKFIEPCDVSSDYQIQAVAEKAQAAFAGIDILIHAVARTRSLIQPRSSSACSNHEMPSNILIPKKRGFRFLTLTFARELTRSILQCM